MKSRAGEGVEVEVPGDLVSATALLCRKLRSGGVPVAVPETLAAVKALEWMDIGDRREVHLGLRALLTTSVRDYDLFDACFREVWRGTAREDPESDRSIPGPSVPSPERGRKPPAGQRGSVSLEAWLRQETPELAEEEGTTLRAPSSLESLTRKDFSEFQDYELAQVTRVARRLARMLARRPARRWRPSARGPRIHMRRTMRAALARGGEAGTLVYKRRKLRKTKLLAVCDVSGSMDLYSRFLLQFLYALQNCFARVETFVFATRLSRISEELEEGDWRRALERLSRQVQDWSGGTRIGSSLAELAQEWPELVDRRTVLLVLSDGWDTGDPEELAQGMARLHERAGRVVWLNPLLGSPGYRPLVKGMQAALPHVDVLAPGHNLKALEELTQHLIL